VAFVAGSAILGLITIVLILYSRLKRDHALTNETRRRIYELVCQEPGIRVGTVASRLQLSPKTVSYHVKMLQMKFGLLKSPSDAATRLLPVGKLTGTEEALALSVFANSTTRSVFNYLKEKGPMDAAALASQIGRSYSTVAAAIAILCKARLVERRRAGNKLIVHVAMPA
jgi:predicted transcriptional regulator